MNWRDDAACARHRMDPAPQIGTRKYREYARAYCSGCPVMANCARDALVHGDVGVVRAGVWITPNRSTQMPHSVRELQAVADG